MQNWNRLIEQAEITIHLLYPSILNTNLSDYTHLRGEFDYNRTPMAPKKHCAQKNTQQGHMGTTRPRGVVRLPWDYPLQTCYTLHPQDSIINSLWHYVTLPNTDKTPKTTPNRHSHTRSGRPHWCYIISHPIQPYPTPIKKQTEALQQLSKYFNKEVPQLQTNFPVKLTRMEQPPVPLYRVKETWQTTTINLPDPPPYTHQRMGNDDTILTTPGRSKLQPPQKASPKIPDNTEVTPNAPKQYYVNPIRLTTVKKYNNRARQMKGQSIMVNHIFTFTLPRKFQPLHPQPWK